MRRLSKVMAGAVVLLITVLGAYANLTVNESFEIEDGSMPFAWLTTANYQYITDGVPGADTHTGTHSVAITNLPNVVWWYATSDGRISVSGGKRLLFTVWVKTVDFDGDDYVQLRVQPFNSSGEALSRKDGKYFQLNSDWQQISWEVTLSADTAEVQPLLAVGDGVNNSASATSMVYFDDVSITIIPEPAVLSILHDQEQGDTSFIAWESKAWCTYTVQTNDSLTDGEWGNVDGWVDVDGDGESMVCTNTSSAVSRFYRVLADLQPPVEYDNLITNGSFEVEYSASYPDAWRVVGNYMYITDGTAGVDTHTGTHSVAITNFPNVVWWYTTNDGKIPVSGGETVLFTAWVKTVDLDGDDYVQLRLQPSNSSGGALSRKDSPYFQVNSDWIQISWETTLTADTALVQPLLTVGDGVNNSASATSIVYFDDVSLVIPE